MPELAYDLITQLTASAVYCKNICKGMMTIKILGVVGSKRKNGNTATLVLKALEAAKNEGVDTEIIYLGDYAIADCHGCEGCQDAFACVIDDDMQEIYPRLLEADAIILGSPTYFYNMSADMKALIDRCYCFETFAKDDRSVWLSINEVLGSRYAAVIAVCEQHAEIDMGNTVENIVKPLEALGYRAIDTVKAFGLFKRTDAANDECILNKAAEAGKKLAKTLKLKAETETKWQRMKQG